MISRTITSVTVGATLVVIFVLLLPRTRAAKKNASENVPPDESRFAFLKWNSEGPCFCRPMIQMNIEKLKPTPETIGAIFGLRVADKIRITTESGESVNLLTQNGSPAWQLQADHRYTIIYDGNDIPPCCIREIFTFLGKDEEQIHKLSLTFYSRIWADESNPVFRSLFTKSVKTPQEAADNQARWLIEMWGGPPRYSEKHGTSLVGTRMLSRHSSRRRMTFSHACTWLDYMNDAVKDIYGDDKRIKLVLGLYWRHFFGFFTMTEEERVCIRNRALGDEIAR